MKTIDKAISMTVGALIAAPAVLAASVVEIEIDPYLPPVKDLTMLKAGAGMGFNGFLGEGVHANADWYYNTHREDTARAFAESGTELVRITDAVVHHQGERAERVMFATRWTREVGSLASSEGEITMRNIDSSAFDSSRIISIITHSIESCVYMLLYSCVISPPQVK